jgi:hypothetical protein
LQENLTADVGEPVVESVLAAITNLKSCNSEGGELVPV